MKIMKKVVARLSFEFFCYLLIIIKDYIMKYITPLFILSISVLLISLLAGLFFIYEYKKDQLKMITELSTKMVEVGYFEGQKDALEGDVRIEKIGNSYVWSSSPWDGGENPKYDPHID